MAIATLLIVAVAALASGIVYALANQPTEDQTELSQLERMPSPDENPWLETRPENQTDQPDGPEL